MQVKANIVAILATCSLLVIAKPLYKGIHASQSVHIYFKYISLLLACKCDAPLSLRLHYKSRIFTLHLVKPWILSRS